MHGPVLVGQFDDLSLAIVGVADAILAVDRIGIDNRAQQVATGNQITQYFYGTTLAESAIASNAADGTQNLVQQRTQNAANEITDIARTVGADWVTPAHDRAGNLTSIPQPASATDGYDLGWDAWNRLSEVADGMGTVASFTYDASSRRQTITASGSTRHMYYSAPWAQVVEERMDAGSTAERQYVWGRRSMDDLVLRDRDSDGNESLDERLYALQDALSSVTAVTDNTGAVQERYAYQAYGTSEVLTATFGARASSSFDWTYRFTGRPLDDDTGLYFYRARYYHSGLGRFLSRDPLGNDAGVNLYRYAADRPTVFVDPMGLQPCNQCTISRIVIVASQDDIDNSLQDVAFRNPEGVQYDLNKPGPFDHAPQAKDDPPRDVHNVHWIVFYGSCLDDCKFTRYVTGVFSGGSARPEPGVRGTPLEPQRGRQPTPIQDKYIDTGGQFGIQVWEFYPEKSKDRRNSPIVAIADAPGTGPGFVRADFVKFKMKWHFVIAARPKSSSEPVAKVAFDVTIEGQFFEGKFRSLDGSGAGTNTVAETGKWIRGSDGSGIFD